MLKKNDGFRWLTEHLLPVLVEVSPGEEAGHGVSGEVMDPALHPQLRHDGIDERVARPGLLPGQYFLLVTLPVDIAAPWIALHAWVYVRIKLLGESSQGDGDCYLHSVKVWSCIARKVEELSPQQL